MLIDLQGLTESYRSVTIVIEKEKLYGKPNTMLTDNEISKLNILVKKFKPKCREVYAKYNLPMTEESVSKIIRDSDLKQNPEYVDYVLEELFK